MMLIHVGFRFMQYYFYYHPGKLDVNFNLNE